MSETPEPGRRRFHAHENAHAMRLEGLPLAAFWQRALGYTVDLLVAVVVWAPLEYALATVIGLMPMAPKLGEGSESYAPLAQALIVTLSVLLTIFLVPAGFLLVYRNGAAEAGA
jgi:hypothetical protein